MTAVDSLVVGDIVRSLRRAVEDGDSVAAARLLRSYGPIGAELRRTGGGRPCGPELVFRAMLVAKRGRVPAARPIAVGPTQPCRGSRRPRERRARAGTSRRASRAGPGDPSEPDLAEPAAGGRRGVPERRPR
jgi:hypothetical protein